ncbi:MAG TPA: hypothetical protein EYG92_11335, partial [Lutibacter sp.]|nr:hypothetical protein [Lutibacter sp.]
MNFSKKNHKRYNTLNRIKKTLLTLILVFTSVLFWGQVTILTQDFEADLVGYSHTPSQTPSTDPGDQYFYRDLPSNNDIYEGSVGPYTNVTDSYLFVGSNPNTINSGNPGVLSLNAIDVSSYSNLELSIDWGAVPNDWDASDELKVEYNFDGGIWSTLYSFESSGDGTNEPIDLFGNATGGNNTANGTTLTYALTTIISDNFIGSGTILNIRIVCDADANYEAFGLDEIILKGTAAGPTITTTPTSLTGFTYVEGSGPSAEQSFTVEGSNLTNDIVVTPPTNWEISTTSGAPYQTTAITLSQSGGTVSTTTLYTRMVSGLLNTNSPFSGDIACTSTGATTVNVAVDGTVTLA